MKLFVIAGHGAGDTGACGNGYQEAERVRALATKIKEYGGNDVMLGDFNRNYYADKGINSLKLSKDYAILELHMDSSLSSARGGHVIIKEGFKPDKYDLALADMIREMFPGRSQSIVPRSNLANVNRSAARGFNYRLMECGFISNSMDVDIFNRNIDKLSKNILKCFEIGVSKPSKPNKPTAPTQSPKKSVTEIAKEVIRGRWGNGNDRVKRLTNAGYNPRIVQDEVDRLLGKDKKPPKKSVAEIAKEVIKGKWGNGSDRVNRLSKAGYDAKAVQKEVNRLLK